MDKFLVIIALFALLLGCAKTPEIPGLPGRQTPSIEQVIVGSEFKVEDARIVFQALNKNGRLNSLKNWFSASDSELSDLAKFFDEYFYQEALKTNGLLDLLQKKMERKGFSDLQYKSLDKKDKDALFAVLNSFSFPIVAKQNSLFLKPEVIRFLESTDSKVGVWNNTQSISPELAANDVLSFLNEKKNISLLENFGKLLEGTNFVENVLLTLQDQLKKFQSPAPFRGFALGLGQKIPSKETEKLFDFLQSLNTSSNGLFSHAHKALDKNKALGRIVSKKLDPVIARAAFHYVKEELQQKRVEPLFFTLKLGLENLTSLGSADSLIAMTPIYLASIVIAQYVDDVQRANPNKTTYTFPASSLNLVDSAETEKVKLNPKIEKALSSLDGMAPFKEVLLAHVTNPEFGSRIYNFEEVKDVTLEKLIESALLSVQNTHRIADGAGLLMPLVRAVSVPGSPSITIEGLETVNMLDSLHRFVGGMSIEMWNRIDYFLFEVIGIGTLSEDDKALVLQLYLEDQKLMDRASAFLNSVELLHTFNKPVNGNLPNALNLCHAFLSNLRLKKDEIRSLGAVMELISKTGLTRYPYISKSLETADPFAKLLYQLSYLSKEEMKIYTEVLNSSLTPELLIFADRFASQNPEELKTLVTLLFTKGRDLLPSLEILTPDERRMIIRILNSKDFEVLWNFFQKHSSRENMRALIGDLKGLIKDGSLLDAAELLNRIQNPLLKKFARVLEKMLITGEFEALLKALENTVSN